MKGRKPIPPLDPDRPDTWPELLQPGEALQVLGLAPSSYHTLQTLAEQERLTFIRIGWTPNAHRRFHRDPVIREWRRRRNTGTA